MPNYDFQCANCAFLVTDVQLKIADRDEPTKEICPSCGATQIERLTSAPGVSYTINGGGLKTPEGFKDVLRDIKRQFPRSTINV